MLEQKSLKSNQKISIVRKVDLSFKMYSNGDVKVEIKNTPDFSDRVKKLVLEAKDDNNLQREISKEVGLEGITCIGLNSALAHTVHEYIESVVLSGKEGSEKLFGRSDKKEEPQGGAQSSSVPEATGEEV